MRLTAATIAAMAAVAAAFGIRGAFDLATLLVALNSLTLVFQGSQIIEYHFQAEMRARAAVIAANVAFLVTSILRLLLLAMGAPIAWRSEEHTSELQSLMRISSAVFCLKKQKQQ